MRIIAVIVFCSLLGSCSNISLVHVIYGRTTSWTEVSKKEIPDVIKEEFTEAFPGRTPEKYYKIGKKHFAITFPQNGMNHLVIYSEKGVLRNDDTNYGPDDYWEEDDMRDFDAWD